MFPRPATLLLVLVTACSTGASPARAAPKSATEILDIPQLIAALSDPDEAVRRQAGDRLASIGAAARPELLKAARSEDPEQRARAAEILKKIPWSTPADPPPVRGLLDRYGPADQPTRIAIIRQLDRSVAGNHALLRLLNEEPGESIRWIIVAFLWNTRDPAVQSAIRKLDGSVDEAPVLMLAGHAWREREPQRALQLFRRAVDLEHSRPSDDSGVLNMAYEALTADALAKGNFDEAAELLRRQVPRDPITRLTRRSIDSEGMPSLGKLMALHAYFGPLRRFDADVRAWGPRAPTESSLSIELTRYMSRLGVAPPIPCRPLELAGVDRYAAGEFLTRNKFPWAAEMEFRAALASLDTQPSQQLEFFTLFQLAEVLSGRGDDHTAADLLERALQHSTPVMLELIARDSNDVQAEIHWRRARAAQARDDRVEADRHVNRMLQLTPANTDLTLSMIEWLDQTSRSAQAKTLFDKVYVQSRARMEATPEPNKAGHQNDLAWLCARAGRRLDEALELAKAAVASSPEHSAFLDTLAEAHFRSGNRDDAIRLERQALELSPENEFMREQLARFQAATTTPAAPGN